jgi:hypothetical protein
LGSGAGGGGASISMAILMRGSPYGYMSGISINASRIDEFNANVATIQLRLPV